MPTAAMTGGTAQKRNAGRQSADVVPSVPFIRASAEHREPTGIDVSKQLTTSDQDLGVFDIPAYGYVRSLWILVTVSGGSGGLGTTPAEDAPFNTIKNLFLTEPNGAVIAQFDTGYDCYLANKWGGYRHVLGSDLRQAKSFVQVPAAANAWSFALRIPVEINLRDGLGSLPNQNAAATFKLRATLAGSSQLYSGGTDTTTKPTVRMRVYLEAWDQPEVSSAGQTNQITPPAMNTTQFWSSQSYTVNAGLNTIRLTRVGNYIRELIMLYRRAGTSRVNGEADWLLVDPMYVYLDTRPLDILQPDQFLQQQFERTGFGAVVGGGTTANETPGGLDNGVRSYDFCHEFDGTIGHENRDLWLPTLGSTRLELQGNFTNAGVLKVLTNDVAIAGSVFI